MLPRQVETLRATAHEFDESARLVTAFQSGAEAHEGMKAGSMKPTSPKAQGGVDTAQLTRGPWVCMFAYGAWWAAHVCTGCKSPTAKTGFTSLRTEHSIANTDLTDRPPQTKLQETDLTDRTLQAKLHKFASLSRNCVQNC